MKSTNLFKALGDLLEQKESKRLKHLDELKTLLAKLKDKKVDLKKKISLEKNKHKKDRLRKELAVVKLQHEKGAKAQRQVEES